MGKKQNETHETQTDGTVLVKGDGIGQVAEVKAVDDQVGAVSEAVINDGAVIKEDDVSFAQVSPLPNKHEMTVWDCLIGEPIPGMEGYFWPVQGDTTEPHATRHSPRDGWVFVKTVVKVFGKDEPVWKIVVANHQEVEV